jgi:PAS domain S-box-containing protein
MRTQGYLAFLVGMILTIWTCLLVADAQRTRLHSNFQRDADRVASDTHVRLQTYFDILLSIKGTFTIHDNIDRAQFVRLVGELKLAERYPGFQAIQFVRYVPDADLERFVATVRTDTTLHAQGYPRFHVHPEAPGDEHYIIEYTEPMKGNENAFGLDLAALAPHLKAVRQARDTGQIASTERIILVQDASGQPGFVARAPVYRRDMPISTVQERRAAFIGLVAVVFKVNSLMNEVIDPELFGHMTFHIHDAGSLANGAGAAPGKNNIMFNTTRPALPMLAGLTAEKRVDVAQRQWVLRFGAISGSRYSADYTRVMLIGSGGFVISALIAALLMASRRSRNLTGKLRVTLDEQRAFQDSANVGIALFSQGLIQRCNLGMEQMMGYAPGELIGKQASILLRAAAQDAIEAFSVDPKTLRWGSELELVRKDGSTIWCLINGKALDAADLSKGGVWVIQDISVRKQTEAALVEAKHGLEHSLAELAEQKVNVESAHGDLSKVLLTLKQAQTNLITSEKMASLGSLVAGIAHELNTPIGNSLLTATALDDMVGDFEKKFIAGGIKRSALDAHLADTKLACTIMTGSLRRAADLITSFKQVAVDQTSDQRRRFDLCEVVRDTLATYAAQLRRANCEVRVDTPVAVILDSYPGSFGQVLSNLINNALLHAFEGRAKAQLQITVRELAGDQILFIFSDDGVGMPARILHQVFDPFFTTKMGQGGSGLGMNIVYNIVTGMLGGGIEIDSSSEHGTSVTIKVPRKAPELEGQTGAVKLLAL